MFDLFTEMSGIGAAVGGKTVVTEAELAAFDSIEADERYEKYDIEESFMNIALENQQNFNNLMMAIAVDEMKYFVENGEEMIYEEGKIKKFFETIKNAIKKVWAKIKAIFKKVITTIAGWIKSDAAYIKKHEEYLKKCDGKTIKDYKGYDIKNIANMGIYKELADDFKSKLKGLNTDKLKNVDQIDDNFGDDDKKTLLDDYFGTIKKKIGYDGDIEETSDCGAAFKFYFGIDNTVTITKFKAQGIIEGIRDCKDSKKAAKIAFDGAKYTIAAYEKEVQVAQITATNLAKGKDSDSDEAKQSKAATKFSSFTSSLTATALAVLTSLNSSHVKAINIAHSQSKKLANYAISEKLADKEDKDDSSSANEGYTLFDSMSILV